MTNEEVINALKTYPTDLDAVPKAAKKEYKFRTALAIAIEIIERNEPKKRIAENKMIDDTFYRCPSCDSYIGLYDTYCRYCGQMLLDEE